MKLKLLVGAIAATTLIGCNKEATAEKEVKLESLEQRASYLVGLNLANQFKSDDFRVDVAALAQAIEDIQAGKEPRLSQDEITSTLTAMQDKQKAKQAKIAEERAAKAEGNKEAGKAFLAENAKQEGVVTLESGLQYKVIAEGAGEKPSLEKPVQVHYRGTLIDGTEFDSSIARGQPAEFMLTQVIPGWTEGLQLMKEGAKWQLFIPSDLAYGAGGSGKITPHSTLVFEVELLKSAVN